MTDDHITITIDGAEAHALEAALTLYRSLLVAGISAGGDARDTALVMGPPALRVHTRLERAMYGTDPIDLALGDHYARPGRAS